MQSGSNMNSITLIELYASKPVRQVMPTATASLILFPNTEILENVAEDFVGGYFAGDLTQGV
jgi:hypothetical protein